MCVGVRVFLIAVSAYADPSVAVMEKFTVDSSAGGSGVVVNLSLLPADSILLEVGLVTVEAFNGDAATEFTVGTTGEPDRYCNGCLFPITTGEKWISGNGG